MRFHRPKGLFLGSHQIAHPLAFIALTSVTKTSSRYQDKHTLTYQLFHELLNQPLNQPAHQLQCRAHLLLL